MAAWALKNSFTRSLVANKLPLPVLVVDFEALVILGDGFGYSALFFLSLCCSSPSFFLLYWLVKQENTEFVSIMAPTYARILPGGRQQVREVNKAHALSSCARTLEHNFHKSVYTKLNYVPFGKD